MWPSLLVLQLFQLFIPLFISKITKRQPRNLNMSTRQINVICLGISFLPFLVSLFFQDWILNFPSTHIFSNNSINPFDINKQTFIILLLFSGCSFYFLSIVVSRSAVFISVRFNIVYTRYLINIILSLSTLLLIMKNIKS